MDEQFASAPASLFRRMAALSYDLLLMAALLLVLTFALLPLTAGEAILTSTHGLIGHLYHALQLLLAFGYFGICWTRGGQTLGMKAWRIRIETVDGRPPNWGNAIVRFMIGATLLLLAVTGSWQLQTPGWNLGDLAALLLVLPAPVNLAWVLFDREGRSLQDRAGQLRLLRLD
ncbi:MAG: RDD family protein [Steroidobacteraceae bacterium]